MATLILSSNASRNDAAQGKVFQQSPAGDTLDTNVAVEIDVSIGSDTFTMPDLSMIIGSMTYEGAKQVLKDAGYRGKFSPKDQQSSDTVPKNLVIAITPATGEEVDNATGTVKITVSTGKAPMIDVNQSLGTVPDCGGPTTFVRVELENPVGSNNMTVLLDQSLPKGDPILVHFQRKVHDVAKLSIYSAPDETSLKSTPNGEEYDPSASRKQPGSDANSPAPTSKTPAPQVNQPPAPLPPRRIPGPERRTAFRLSKQ